MGRLGAQVGVHGGGGAHVEVEGADQLDGRGQPVDLVGAEDQHPAPPVGAAPCRRPGPGVHRLAVLEEAGRGEEQRADEEGDRVGPGPDGAGVAGQGPDGEEGGPGCEEDPDPPPPGPRSPPGARR